MLPGRGFSEGPSAPAPERGGPDVTDYDLRHLDDVARLRRRPPDLVIHLAARVGGIGANMARPADLYLDNLLMGTYVIEQARLGATPRPW